MAGHEDSREWALAPGEAPGAGLQRVLVTQLRQAAELLGDSAVPLDTAVHEARKRIKRARALLRLLRPVRRATAVLQNRRLRDTAAGLGAARDATVLLETLTGLAEGGEASEPIVAPLRARQRAATGALHRGGGRERAAAALARSAAVISRLRLTGLDARTLAEGIQRTVKRGRRAEREARAGEHAERYHEWRKRAKELRYQLELLRETAPTLIAGRAAEAKELEEELGEEHNLAVLAEALGHAPPDWRHRVQAERERRQGRAHRVGESLYRDPARTWGRRLREAWEREPKETGHE